MTSVCDLQQDFDARAAVAGHPSQTTLEQEADPSFLPHVILCEVYEEAEIRNREGIHAGIWKPIAKNQDERYHSFPPAACLGSDEQMPRLVMDFRRTLAVPTMQLYKGIFAEDVERIAIVPDVFVHDLVHRFYSFHARVGVDW